MTTTSFLAADTQLPSAMACYSKRMLSCVGRNGWRLIATWVVPQSHREEILDIFKWNLKAVEKG